MMKKVVELMSILIMLVVFVSCNADDGRLTIGQGGPAGGIIFYDCDADNDFGNADGLKSSECGWRYLEVAPQDLTDEYCFGYYRDSDTSSNKEVGTDAGIGKGKGNTEALVKAMGETAYTRSSGTSKEIYAAKACAEYTYGDYDDWFLPSKEELNLLYKNLGERKIMSFARDTYWSSSEYSISSYAWSQNFNGGIQDGNSRGSYSYVRPIRAFK